MSRKNGLSKRGMNKKAKLRKLADKKCYEKYLKPNCEICGQKANQLHHYFRKSCYSHLRYCPENLISLCAACHFRLTHCDNRLEDKIRQARGEKWFEALQKKAYQNPKSSYLTVAYYKEIIKEIE